MRSDSTHRLPGPRAAVLLPLALAAAATTGGAANVVQNSWTSVNNFHHKRVGVPDQDQKRVGLPNSGACYCVPTSIMNVLMYVANHGFPQVKPGPGDYSGYDTYYEVTDLLEFLGKEASISPGGDDPDDPDCNDAGGDGGDGECGSLPCGGKAQNVYDVLIAENWFGEAKPNLVFTARFLDENAPAASFANLAQLGIQGHVLAFGYGRYKPVGGFQGQTIYRRSTGHVVTMNEAYAFLTNRWLYARDPGQDDDDIFGPSPYTTKKYDVTDQTILVTTQDPGEILVSWSSKTFSMLDEPHADGIKRAVDSYFAIRPKTGVFWKDYFGVNTLDFAGTPGGGGGGGAWPSPTVQFGDLVLDQDQLGWFVLLPGSEVAPAQLAHINPFESAPETLHATAATRLALGRRCEIFATVPSPPMLEKYNCFGERVDALPLPGPPSAVAYDDATDRVFVLIPPTAPFGGTILDFPTEVQPGGPPVITHTIPTTVPVGGATRLAKEPKMNRLWLSSQSAGRAFGFEIVPGVPGSLVLVEEIGGFGALTGIEFDDEGLLYAVDGGTVKIFQRVLTGGWQNIGAGPFAGMDVGQIVRIARSRTNFDPEIHDTDSWDHIDADDLEPLGETIPDCLGDLNGDGTVDGADLGLLLAAWNGRGLPDLDGDGTVDGADLGLLLSVWGPCPR